jgi:hypothetical protein
LFANFGLKKKQVARMLNEKYIIVEIRVKGSPSLPYAWLWALSLYIMCSGSVAKIPANY